MGKLDIFVPVAIDFVGLCGDKVVIDRVRSVHHDFLEVCQISFNFRFPEDYKFLPFNLS